MKYLIKDNFLPEVWYECLQQKAKSYKGQLSREGYNNKKTFRDSLDPRHAETKEIEDRRGVCHAIWNKFLWNAPLEKELSGSKDSALVHASQTRWGKVLLSSYGEKDGYGYHIDTELDCIATAVLMFTLSSKPKFSGGDFLLEDKIILFKPNRLIIFPSCRKHGVSLVSMKSNDIYENRRFTLQYFISSVTLKTRFPDESYIK